MANPTIRKTSPVPVIIALVVLVALAAVFVGELADVSREGGDAVPGAQETLTADSYLAVIQPLLADADPARGEALVARYGCVACHDGPGAENRLAPAWAGVASRAETRRPPLTAAAYLYESIVHPTAFEIEGYTANMPLIYGRTIPETDLGDIVAYLLTRADD